MADTRIEGEGIHITRGEVGMLSVEKLANQNTNKLK